MFRWKRLEILWNSPLSSDYLSFEITNLSFIYGLTDLRNKEPFFIFGLTNHLNNALNIWINEPFYIFRLTKLLIRETCVFRNNKPSEWRISLIKNTKNFREKKRYINHDEEKKSMKFPFRVWKSVIGGPSGPSMNLR